MRRLLLPALLALAAQVAAQSNVQRSDWELEREKSDLKESDLKLPAYPRTDGLIEFFVSGATNFRFYIDPVSVTRETGGVVRYTLVARSPAGVSNVSYEGIRCPTNTFKVYAFGNEGRWSVRESEWREIEPRSVQRWHLELRSRYFCPGNAQILTAAEGVESLRSGGYRAGADPARGN